MTESKKNWKKKQTKVLEKIKASKEKMEMKKMIKMKR